MGQGDTMVHMEDTSNDMWALGCAFFMMATCTSPGWEPAFKPQEAVTMRHIKALPPQQQRGACAAAILKEQHRLVGCSNLFVGHCPCFLTYNLCMVMS